MALSQEAPFERDQDSCAIGIGIGRIIPQAQSRVEGPQRRRIFVQLEEHAAVAVVDVGILWRLGQRSPDEIFSVVEMAGPHGNEA